MVANEELSDELSFDCPRRSLFGVLLFLFLARQLDQELSETKLVAVAQRPGLLGNVVLGQLRLP